ncbi:MAG: hypothetical protein LBP79_06845 [Clostridiales bacterium]|nr:hypothetical protein [Clostridiales bacterium]
MSEILWVENITAFFCGAFVFSSLMWLVKNKPIYVYAALSNSFIGGVIYLASALAGAVKTSLAAAFMSGLLGVIGFALSLLEPVFMS